MGKPTRAGLILIALTVLTLLAALVSGNNLLYLLYSLMFSALIISPFAAWLNLRNLSATVEPPENALRDNRFPLKIRLRKQGKFPAYLFRIRIEEESCFVERLNPGEETLLAPRIRLPHRGLNQIENLVLESAFPLGLLKRRIRISCPHLLALPRLGAFPALDLPVDASERGALRPRKGAGDELYGLRGYAPGDDARLIHWKISARTGRLTVQEFAEPGGSKLTLRLMGLSGGGEEVEKRIEEAASACKHLIEKGAEIRLITDEFQSEYGKGHLHLDKLLTALALLGEGRRPRPIAQKTPQRNSPKLPAQMLKQSYAGALLICAALFLVEDINPWLTSLLSLACALGWQMDKHKGTLLSESVWRLCSLTMLCYILLWGWRISGITVANTHLLLYLMLNRILSPKGPIELRQMFLILFIGFFLISGQTISLWYFPIFLLYVGFAGSWLMLVQYESWAIKAPPLWALGMILLACLSASGLAFAATPRLEPLRRMNPLQVMGFDKRRVESQAVVAFSENVSLGFFGQLKKSGARALQIKPVVPASRPALKLYVRGCAFDHFNGRSWKKSRVDFRYRMGPRIYWSAQGRAWMPRQESRWIAPGKRPGQEILVLEFNVFPMNSTVLFTAQTPRELEQAQLENAVYFDYTDTLYFHVPYSLGTQYRISADAKTLGYSADILDYEVLRAKFLQLPDQDSKISELAYKITRGARSPLEQIKAIERYLHKGYAYSSFSNNPNMGLSEFLFSVHKGNCEYFATAAAVLLRHVGIPSRLVTGFLADEWNEFGSFFDVRQGQAHAWTEAYVDGMGWVALDATPAQGVFTTQAGEIFQRFRRYFDAAQLRWYRNIIGYDNFLQKNTFYRFQLSWKSQDMKRWASQGLGGLLALLGLSALRAAGKRLGSWLRRKPAGHFERALRALARQGLHRAPDKTAREFASSVAEIRPELAAVTDLVELHYKQRYSGSGLEPAEERRADKLLKEICSRVSR